MSCHIVKKKLAPYCIILTVLLTILFSKNALRCFSCALGVGALPNLAWFRAKRRFWTTAYAVFACVDAADAQFYGSAHSWIVQSNFLGLTAIDSDMIVPSRTAVL